MPTALSLAQNGNPAQAETATPSALDRIAGFIAKKPWQFLSGTALKWIALVCMLLDHIGAVLIWTWYLQLRTYGAHGSPLSISEVYDLYMILRQIGRTTFPIFCFMITEGFTHTRSKPKYALRLLLFAIVSEIPYDLAVHGGTVDYLSKINVMFTLLLGFLAIWAADEVGTRLKLPEWATGVLTAAAIAGAAVLSGDQYLDVSYHEYGIVLIGLLYLARRSRLAQVAGGAAAGWWYCTEHGSWLQMYSMIGLVLLLFYNGKRGRGMKYFFYLFYPLHLLVLYLLKTWLF